MAGAGVILQPIDAEGKLQIVEAVFALGIFERSVKLKLQTLDAGVKLQAADAGMIIVNSPWCQITNTLSRGQFRSR